MPPNSTGDQLDAALDAILSSGWTEADAPAQVAAAPEPEHEFPPLPVKELPYQAPRQRKPSLAPPRGGVLVPVATHKPPDDEQEPQEPRHALMNMGVLANLASGRITPLEAADAAGVAESDVQEALASALHEMDPKEVAKAMGIQAAEQQLKSGAMYGAVLNDLVQDIRDGRVKHETKVELLKLLAKVGKLEPKEDKGVAGAGGFSLVINMGGAPQPLTIDAV